LARRLDSHVTDSSNVRFNHDRKFDIQLSAALINALDKRRKKERRG
jgi:hypothetical protein